MSFVDYQQVVAIIDVPDFPVISASTNGLGHQDNHTVTKVWRLVTYTPSQIVDYRHTSIIQHPAGLLGQFSPVGQPDGLAAIP